MHFCCKLKNVVNYVFLACFFLAKKLRSRIFLTNSMSVTVYLHEAGNVLNQEGEKIAEDAKAKAQHPDDKKESQSWYNCYQWCINAVTFLFCAQISHKQCNFTWISLLHARQRVPPCSKV